MTIYYHANIGTDRPWTPNAPNDHVPQVGDRSVIYPYSTVQGPWRIGLDAVVGLKVVVDEDVPAGALKTITQLRRRGEWKGEDRSTWTPSE